MSWSYLEDASGAKGHAEKICVPNHEAELIQILHDAAAAKVAVTIAGGGSGLTGGRVPFGGWQISMEKFRRLDVHTLQSFQVLRSRSSTSSRSCNSGSRRA